LENQEEVEQIRATMKMIIEKGLMWDEDDAKEKKC
jgi:hypothetical protein